MRHTELRITAVLDTIYSYRIAPGRRLRSLKSIGMEYQLSKERIRRLEKELRWRLRVARDEDIEPGDDTFCDRADRYYLNARAQIERTQRRLKGIPSWRPLNWLEIKADYYMNLFRTEND